MANDLSMDIETFQSLPVESVAHLMKTKGPKVCGFPINGTRRWYLLEGDNESNYLDKTARQHVEIYRMLFAHGVDTLLAPVFGSELLKRGPEYLKIAAEGLSWLATHPIFLDFYREYGVRVHFYGNYRKQLSSTPYAHLSDLFDRVTAQTMKNTRCRLFFGVFADNAIDAITELPIHYYSEHGRAPNERQLLEMVYGEFVGPVSFFIGFDKFWIFDIPLLSTENTDLYFTVSPSLYLSQRQLRAILFDHLFARCVAEPDYNILSPEARNRMRAFYIANAESVFGVGALHDGIWYPRLAVPGSPELS